MLALCLAPLAAQAHPPACVLPPPDGAVVDWTPANLAGVIQRIAKDRISIRAADGKLYPLRVSGSTWLSTAYGGGVDPADLKVGQHALVWLQGCAVPGSTDRAVIIQVCSLGTEPCPG